MAISDAILMVKWRIRKVGTWQFFMGTLEKMMVNHRFLVLLISNAKTVKTESKKSNRPQKDGMSRSQR